MLLENGCTFYDRQIKLLNVDLSRSFSAQNVQAVHQKNFGKVRN